MSPTSRLKEPMLATNPSWGPLSKLPVEVLDNVLQSLPRDELLPCLRVNSAFNTIASRVLYRTIDKLKPPSSILCLLELERNPRVRTLVRTLDLDWNGPEASIPTRNLYNLLHRVLLNLTGLLNLSLELPRTDGPCWILSGCTFALQVLSTSLPCDMTFAHFLDTQPSIRDLSLRGLNYHICEALPFIVPGFPTTTFSTQIPDFPLAPTSLPRLTSLRSVHGGPSIIANVAQGRPVEVASLALFPTKSSQTLKALSLSKAPIRRLSLMSFDSLVPQHDLISEVSSLFPHLEALHLVILLAEYSTEKLKRLGPLLAGFKTLHYITYMAAPNGKTLPGDESEIASLWHHWCPTLKTIILPTGKVWFEGQLEL
ncbi:hypothetical protein DXG03_009578 [Asterophora parasitica]|uniref:F-box domain-containing protein n=1 Tax=Asterophora parasitica TaxID=117018 RepID=A0A9P7G4B2_9AGAR|nr:hypothetical protein DXG03_009578 [Asterophora parasitica]